MNDLKIAEEVSDMEAFYWDEEEELEKVNNKNFEKKTKALELLLKQQNQKAQNELEAKRLDFEIEQSKVQNELESKKLEVQQETNRIENVKTEQEAKAAKKDFWLGVIKVAAAVIGTIASVIFGVWSLVTTMKFEETGCVRTAAGKAALNLAKGTMNKLDNVSKNV